MEKEEAGERNYIQQAARLLEESNYEAMLTVVEEEMSANARIFADIFGPPSEDGETRNYYQDVLALNAVALDLRERGFTPYCGE